MRPGFLSPTESRDPNSFLVPRIGGSHVEHDERASGKRCGFQRGACRQRRDAAKRQPFDVELLHRFEILDVRQQQSDHDHVCLRAPRRVQDGPDIRQHAPGLGFETVFELAGFRVAARLAGQKDEVACANRVRVRAGSRRGGVGRDGGLG